MTNRCVIVRDGTIGIENRAATGRGPGEATLEVLRVGLSHLDAAIGQGRMSFDGIPGQELVGRVIDVDEADADWRSRRVVVDPLVTCGQCEWCLGGVREHCGQRRIIGRQGADGGLAEQIVVPISSLVAVPDHVDDDSAVFAVPVGRALQAARQARIEGKTYVTIVGDNALALLTAQVLVRRNASVRVLGEHRELLDRCERWGIRHRHRDEAGLRGDQDIVVECTGDQAAMAATLGFVRPRGTVIQMVAPETVGAEGTVLDLRRLVDAEVRLVGSSFGPVAEAMNLIATDGIDVVSVVGVRRRLDDVPSLLTDPQLATGRKVLVSP
ncbi:MAG: alcohol dehydrogenase catalytic domain-containing protein [Phycisphaerales bacterium]|nr:alcohol dehydrogenase catalytic domain-containing protein [Phycisphaerales bacterium]